MFLALLPHAADIWILIGAASFLATVGCFYFLVVKMRNPGIPIDDHLDEDQTLTDSSFRKNRQSVSRKEIFDGMAKVGVSGSHPVLAGLQTEAELTSTGTKTAWTMWDDIADSRAEKPAASPLPPPEPAVATVAPDKPEAESMVERPETCPFCGQDPTPDYKSKEVEGGLIYSCPHCRCIVYAKPRDLVYRYGGQRYHVPEGKPFVPPDKSRVEAMQTLPIVSKEVAVNQDGEVVGIFDDITD